MRKLKKHFTLPSVNVHTTVCVVTHVTQITSQIMLLLQIKNVSSSYTMSIGTSPICITKIQCLTKFCQRLEDNWIIGMDVLNYKMSITSIINK